MSSSDSFEWSIKLQRSEFASSGAAINRKQPKLKAERSITIADLKHPNETFEAAKERFQIVTKQNIEELLKWKPVTASELGIEGRWLKRLQEFGLGYPSKASLGHLEKLADHFGYSNYLHLWREDLLELMGLPEPTEEKVAKWKHSPNWRRAEKLLELLDSGDFDHLATLIDDMYELGIARTSKSSEKPSAVATSMKDFVKKKGGKK